MPEFRSWEHSSITTPVCWTEHSPIQGCKRGLFMTSTNAASAGVDQRSGRTRVTPVFEWFQAYGGSGWVAELLQAWLCETGRAAHPQPAQK
jgi:hypothetical protein